MNPTERIDSPGSLAPAGAPATERLAALPVISADPAPTERLAQPVVSANPMSSLATTAIGTSLTLGQTTYQLRQLLARSGEAEVYLVEAQQQRLVWKLYHQDFMPKQEIVDSLKRMKHANLMALLNTGTYEGRFYELNEYLAGGTLDELKPLTSADRLKEVVRQVNEALHLCHQHRIIHRDIKPQNIFFRDAARTEVVLGDFGISSQLDAGASSRVTTRARTSLYAAPELFTEIKGKTTLGIEVDYYALGVTILEVWDGQNPFGSDLEHNMMRAKTGGRFMIPPGMTGSFNSLVKGLLTPNYEDRWGYEQVAAWCRGEANIPLKFAALFDYRPYLVGKRLGLAEDSAINSPEAMGVFIGQHEKIGIELLYGNKISQWLYAAGDTEKADQITDVVEKDYPKDQKAGLLEAVFILNPEQPLLGYDGITRLDDFAAIATYFEQHADHYRQALQRFTDPFYAFLMAHDVVTDIDPATGATHTTDYKAKARTFHGLFQDRNLSPAKALNTILLDLQNGELTLGNTQTRFDRLDAFVTVANPDFQQFVVEQFVDADSKAVVWLETYHLAEAKAVLHWRKAGQHSVSTLGYALGVRGYRLAGQEARNPNELLDMIATDTTLFFTAPDAADNRAEADYWLKNYQQSALAQVLTEALRQQRLAPQHLIEVIGYGLDQNADIAPDPYAAATGVLQAAEPLFGLHQATFTNDLVSRLTVFYTELIGDNPVPRKTATHRDLFEPLVGHLTGLPAAYQAVGTAVMNRLNDTIETWMYLDFVIVALSDTHFLAYYDWAEGFVNEQLAKHFPGLPLLANWQQRQQLLANKTDTVRNKLRAEKDARLAESEQKFATPFKEARAATQEQCAQTLATQKHKGDAQAFYLAKGRRLLLGLGVTLLFTGIGWLILAILVLGYLPLPIKPAIRKLGQWFVSPIVSACAQQLIDSGQLFYNGQFNPYQQMKDRYEASIKLTDAHFARLEQKETLPIKRAVFMTQPR